MSSLVPDNEDMWKLNLSLVVGLSLSVVVPSALAQVSAPQAVTGEYIVKFKQQSSVSSAGLSKMAGTFGASVSVKNVFAASRMMHLKVNDEAARDALYANPDVEFIEPNYILSVNPVDVSPLGSAPQASDSYGQSRANVQVRDSWNIQKPYDSGDKVVVAVIDTGLDRGHLLFKDSGAIWENEAEKNGQAGVDDDGNGYVDDINGWNYVGSTGNVHDDNNHGTHVAGIVLGVGQDVMAYPVRESKLRILPLKFLDSKGAGSTANAVSAIYYAVAKGAKVINNSWGGPSYSQSLHEAYAYAYNNGVVIVSAAGNSNTNNDSTPMYPANINSPNNISVASTTDSDYKSSFSNYGVGSVHVAAPGSSILSSVPGSGCFAPGCYQMMSGTSMAAPFVAGLAALILREAPQLSSYQVKSIIEGSLDRVNGLSTVVSTSGRVNAYKAIINAKANVDTPPWSPAYAPDYKTSRSTASAMEALPGAGCGLVKALVDKGGTGGGSGAWTLVAILMLPFAVAVALRNRKEAQTPATANRRIHDRFSVAKKAVLKANDQLIDITTADMSVGGISFKSDAGLNKGQIIELQFSDKADEKLEAEVVWCSTKQEYGLRFLNVSESIKFQIQSWTQGLIPT